MRHQRTLRIPATLLAISVALLPALSPSVGARIATWITPFGGQWLLATGLFVACLFLLNRIVLGLYQEFVNRE